MKTSKKAIHVLRALVDAALTFPMSRAKVGEFVTRAKSEDRELLKDLKAEDTDKDRWPIYDNLFDKNKEGTRKREQKHWRNKLNDD